MHEECVKYSMYDVHTVYVRVCVCVYVCILKSQPVK